MEEWFTVDLIDDTTYIISEYQHWEETHCYLLCGTKLAVLIDTGLGVSNIKKVVDKITRLRVLVITTHVHWDHIGGHRYFNNFAVHEAEHDWLSTAFPIPEAVVKHNLLREPCTFPVAFDIDAYHVFQGNTNRIVYDGDFIDLGNRVLHVIHTPGHSPGHCCFYEEDRRYLFTGDLIYKGCLDAFYPTTNPQQFFTSLRKIQGLQVDNIFPGHHQLDIPVDMISKVEQGFYLLEKRGQLAQGNGIFDFGDFQIHI